MNTPCILALLCMLVGQALVAQDPWHVAVPPPHNFDRARAQRDALEHLKHLIGLDTQNPPGNEIRTAAYLDSVLRPLPGFETHVIDPGDGRANFIARLRATRPTSRPVLIMGHMDVVGADPAKWTTPPFQPTERDGYLYGRGAIDDKGMLAATVAVLLQLAPQRDRLDRDIILLGTAAEEGGDQGIDRVIERHFHLIKDAEFALNEGGRIRIHRGRVQSVNIQVTEKLSYTVTATGRGPSGHGSVPISDNALAALARALTRVHDARLPAQLNATTREYFRRLATIEEDPAMKRAMETLARARGVRESGKAPESPDEKAIQAAARLLSRDPLHNAVLRTGVSLTILSGGFRANVIPSEGQATLNVRTLPDGDILADVATLNRIGGENSVTFALQGAPRKAPQASPITSPLFIAMETAARIMAPGAATIPFMSAGATDGAVLRANGIPTYGILPMPLPLEDELRMHGDDERVPVPALGWAAEYLFRVLTLVSIGA